MQNMRPLHPDQRDRMEPRCFVFYASFQRPCVLLVLRKEKRTTGEARIRPDLMFADAAVYAFCIASQRSRGH